MTRDSVLWTSAIVLVFCLGILAGPAVANTIATVFVPAPLFAQEPEPMPDFTAADLAPDDTNNPDAVRFVTCTPKQVQMFASSFTLTCTNSLGNGVTTLKYPYKSRDADLADKFLTTLLVAQAANKTVEIRYNTSNKPTSYGCADDKGACQGITWLYLNR